MQIHKLRWLITGGCGFIGTQLIRMLIKEKAASQIRVLDNLSVGSRADLQKAGSEKDINLVVGDIKDYPACLAACEDMDIVVHLAANTGVGPSVENPRDDMENNVIGTFNLLEAARVSQVQRFVFASSGAPIGECEPPIHEEMAPHPVSPYGASKLAGEAYCSAYCRTFGLQTVALRFGNVYGPGSGHKSSVVAKFIKRALEGRSLEIYGDGGQTRDFIFIEDLVDAIMLAATRKDVGGEVFQIATSSETTVNEVAEMLRDILGGSGCNEIRIVHAEERTGDVKRNFSDTTKASNLLNWKNRVDLRTGLKMTVDWFLGH